MVRVHDACFTSEVLGSLKCDCREQLHHALEYIHAAPPGMVIYLQQEGRGIGLANKIAAYALQEKGLDTVDANRALGLPDDCREYTAVRHILQDLGIKSIRLMVSAAGVVVLCLCMFGGVYRVHVCLCFGSPFLNPTPPSTTHRPTTRAS